MQNQVIADIEIEDQKIAYYSAVVIRQQFNAHHEFAIRIKYDVLEKLGSYSLNNAQKLIGKSAIIRLKQADDLAVAYEFRGLICEINMEQSDNFTSDFVLKGYSPTILLETGPHFLSFYKKNLQKIVQQLTQPVTQASANVNVKPAHTATLNYICQYRESTFHFLNRLSSDFGEWFYYDGKDLFFGKPSSSPNIDITYGEDVHNIQFKLRILPMNFSSYSYSSKDDKFLTYDAPSGVDGLDQYASHALQESNKIFAEPVSFPSKQRVENKSELEKFVKKQKASMAADLEVLTGSSDNPALSIGSVATLKISILDNNIVSKDDGGKFLITNIEHHITENGRYYNIFEGIPSGLEVIPVRNIIPPIAEPQIATVKDNKDPDNMGRIRVQMLWQQANNDMTDWLRVMTPDAGGGKDGAKNRGMVFIPEVGDQVLVCFRYNDPNRPFVLGSLFHGKTGGGGGQGNKGKNIVTKSGIAVTTDDDTGGICVADAQGNLVNIDGGGNISINSTATILLSCTEANCSDGSGTVKSSIKLNVDGTIEIKAEKGITIEGTNESVKIHSTQLVEVSGDNKASVKSNTEVDLTAPTTDIKGNQSLKLGGTAVQMNGNLVSIGGDTKIDINGKELNLNC